MSEATSNKFSFRAVEVFIAVLEEGSVNAAAKRLGASASAVSLQLSNLEKQLGVKLIERSSKMFALTAAGEIFKPRALRILDEVGGAKAALSATGATPKMTFNIAMMEDFERGVLPSWILSLQSEFGDLNFNVTSTASHESHQALGSRAMDMIIAAESTDPVDWIEDHPLLIDPYVLVLSSAVSGLPTDVDQLMRFPFVRYSREQLVGRQIESQLRRVKSVPPRRYECNSNMAVFSLVEAIGGWTISTASSFLGFIALGAENGNWPSMAPLPLPAFNRRIALSARSGSLGILPERFAECFRAQLAQNLVQPGLQHAPFLNGRLRVLPDK